MVAIIINRFQSLKIMEYLQFRLEVYTCIAPYLCLICKKITRDLRNTIDNNYGEYELLYSFKILSGFCSKWSNMSIKAKLVNIYLLRKVHIFIFASSTDTFHRFRQGKFRTTLVCNEWFSRSLPLHTGGQNLFRRKN